MRRVTDRVDDAFLKALVSQVTAGFGGKVALAPRMFLRELIDVLDRVDIHEAYDPREHYNLELDDGKLTAEELAAKHGRPVEEPAEDPESPTETDSSGPAPSRNRLDG